MTVEFEGTHGDSKLTLCGRAYPCTSDYSQFCRANAGSVVQHQSIWAGSARRCLLTPNLRPQQCIGRDLSSDRSRNNHDLCRTRAILLRIGCFGICGPQPPMLAAVDCQSPSSTSVVCTATVANMGYEAVPVVADACTIQFGNSNLTGGEDNGTMIGTPGILGGHVAIAAKSSQSITCTVQTSPPAEGTQFLLSVLFSDGYSVGVYGNWPTS